MAITPVNGAPMTYFYGTDDQSRRQIPREPETRPTHLPLFYTYAKKGREDVFFLVGGSRQMVYGAETFDELGKYVTHQTICANLVNGQGNLCAYKRVRPSDANGPATLRIWMDVLEDDIPVYEREIDGSYVIDQFGARVPTGPTVPGYVVKYVSELISGDFGQATVGTGDQTDSGNTKQSSRYPFLDIEVDSFGAWGNNVGLSLWAPTQNSSNPIDDRILSQQKIYPFRIAPIERANPNTTGRRLETVGGEQYLDVVFKPETRNKFTLRDMFVEDILIEEYQDIKTVGYPPIYGPFGKVHAYVDSIETLIYDFYQAESAYIDAFSDITGEDDEEYKFNFISGVSSQNVPYHSFIINIDDQNAINLSENSAIYAGGGSDGTMDEDLFAELVSEDVVNFADRNHEYQNTAKYPISHIYDTGFPLQTKYDIGSVLAVRKDIVYVCSTYDVNGMAVSASDESSIGQALKTTLQMYPESEYFGTSTMRAIVVPRYGKLVTSKYRKKLPLTLEIAYKSAKYMGAGSRQWDSRESFEGEPGNISTLFTDISNTFTPATVRNKDWDNGLVGVLDYDRSSVFFPAFKTIYDNDTSVLNSYITVCAIAELEKIGEEVWRELSGRSDLSEAQLVSEVQERFNRKTTSMFAGRFVITPRAYFTADDRARGYSWTLEVTIYAPTMYTVQKLIITARRMSDLEEQQ